MSSHERTAEPILPAHIEETVQAIARLHARHRQGAVGLQWAVEAFTGFLGRPLAAVLVGGTAIGWIAANDLLSVSGLSAPDPRRSPPLP
jgi:hypothetical protein